MILGTCHGCREDVFDRQSSVRQDDGALFHLICHFAREDGRPAPQDEMPGRPAATKGVSL